jgi:hypothetical protein
MELTMNASRKVRTVSAIREWFSRAWMYLKFAHLTYFQMGQRLAGYDAEKDPRRVKK